MDNLRYNGGAAVLLQLCPDCDSRVYLRSILAGTHGCCQQPTAECDGFPHERRHDERQRPSLQPLPRVLSWGCSFFFPFFFFAVATADICADFTTSRALDSRRHMVTDWVDWHQASSSLMPTDLGLQMSLSLMKGRKKKRFCWAHLAFFSSLTFCLSWEVFKMFSSYWNPLFSEYNFEHTLLRLPICLFIAQLPISLSFTTSCAILFLFLSLKRRATGSRTGPVLSPLRGREWPLNIAFPPLCQCKDISPSSQSWLASLLP